MPKISGNKMRSAEYYAGTQIYWFCLKLRKKERRLALSELANEWVSLKFSD